MLSCPGCGTTVAPETQERTSADWMTQVAWPELPGSASSPAVESAGKAARVFRRPVDSVPRPVDSADESDEQAAPLTTPARDAAAVVESASDTDSGTPGDEDGGGASSGDGQRAQPRKRRLRGLRLGATVTGGFAGIAVIGLLVFGNLTTAGGERNASAGALSTGTSSAQRNLGPSATSASTLSAQAVGASAKKAPTTSASPGSPAVGRSATGSGTQPTSPATAPASSAGSAPSATRSATAPATTKSPSPSPSQSRVSCILVICW